MNGYEQGPALESHRGSWETVPLEEVWEAWSMGCAMGTHWWEAEKEPRNNLGGGELEHDRFERVLERHELWEAENSLWLATWRKN
jgi:hypothetical protein